MIRESDSLPSYDRLAVEALDTGCREQNPLLVDYGARLLAVQGESSPGALDIQESLARKVRAGHVWRWLDTAVEGETSQAEDALLADKIHRTLGYIAGMKSGDISACYVAAPALNEEANLPGFVESFRRQEVQAPIGLVVADNNSTDRTTDKVLELGGNVVPAPTPGVGAARNAAISHVLANTEVPLNDTLVIQTDVDCLPDTGYLQNVVDAFRANPDIQIGIGPSVFDIPMEGGETLRVETGKAYRALVGSKTIEEYFAALGRDASSYLRNPPYYYLVGANTVFRGSIFNGILKGYRYPEDGRWETVDLSIRLQQDVSSEDIVQRIDGQRMHISPRTILGDRPYLTSERIKEMRQEGVGMYKAEGVSTSPFGTVREIVDEIDQMTYGLEAGETIEAIASWDTLPETMQACSDCHEDHYVMPLQHAGDGTYRKDEFAIVATASSHQ